MITFSVQDAIMDYGLVGTGTVVGQLFVLRRALCRTYSHQMRAWER